MMQTQDLYQIEMICEQVVIIFCTTYKNPISYLPSIEQELSKINFSGKIIFDLLLSNGYSSNRFVEADVFEAQINRRSMKVIDFSKLDDFLIEKTHEFYKSHPYLLETNSILLDEEKYYLIHS
ncbi:antitoxin RnlB [Nostoc commune NIES-4072]|uniref:Antitoxin RnlB n=1 Tax=Nostoc commune NIES-4072 TaxID=2005467 RepID=A0A2R5FPZ2_NOSCO|nr:type II toxin-antitoxin system RnlB family antitoxin [Nostoc commune]BBD68174.1 antitoxin RnlB [Nostoc commune HK-02]GBG20832.1 antitoxin RnlB [Nostoc commune NIES-4072]